MTYDLSEDQRALQDLVRRVARERVADRTNEINRLPAIGVIELRGYSDGKKIQTDQATTTP